MPDFLIIGASAACLIWFWLLLSHHDFWRADQRLTKNSATLSDWPSVGVVIPARNEADVIASTAASLEAQDYPGQFQILLVDDQSEDYTAKAARASTSVERLKIIQAPPLSPGWTGKLAAMNHGVEHALKHFPSCAYLFFTDADIHHPPDALRHLVIKAETESRNLISIMVRLNCESIWERFLIPAFVFFFQKLFPFPAVNNDNSPIAAAAGGVMLVRRDALQLSGGLSAIRGHLIDDCALASLIKKKQGRIWLGLADQTKSISPYPSLSDIWNMVTRTAYTQLDYAPLKLIGATFGMTIVYMAGPAIFISFPAHENAAASSFGLLAWMLMSCAYFPTITYYRQPILSTISLPLAGFFYTLMTLDSAYRHWRRRGSKWKGRTY